MKPAEGIPVFELFGETAELPDVLHCERIKDRASEHGWNISAHRHTRMSQVILIETGMANSVLDNETFVFECNTFLFIPANCVHSFSFSPDTEGLVITLPLDIVHSLGPLSKEAAASLTHPIKGSTTQELSSLTELFANAYQSISLFRAQLSVALAHAMLASIAAIGCESVAESADPQKWHLQQFDRLLTEHLAQGWKPCDYADALAISTGHLSRLCRASQGVSASVYIEIATMTEAARLLAFTQMPVANVGYKLGFADPSYFSRRFKNTRGITPTEYRNQFSDNTPPNIEINNDNRK